MKKILTTALIMTMFTGASFAATNFGNAVKNAVKQDIANTKSAVKTTVQDVKTAAKQDMENQKKAQESTAAAKKAEKLKQIDSKLDELNKELTSVKKDTSITETERTLRIKTLERQIEFYNKQKKALQ